MYKPLTSLFIAAVLLSPALGHAQDNDTITLYSITQPTSPVFSGCNDTSAQQFSQVVDGGKLIWQWKKPANSWCGTQFSNPQADLTPYFRTHLLQIDVDKPTLSPAQYQPQVKLLNHNDSLNTPLLPLPVASNQQPQTFNLCLNRFYLAPGPAMRAADRLQIDAKWESTEGNMEIHAIVIRRALPGECD